MTVFIYLGVAACIGTLYFLPTAPSFVIAAPDPEVVASQMPDEPHFRKMDEISGIALASFRDETGNLLFWGHEEKTSHLVLLRAQPYGSLYAGEVTMPGSKTRDAEDIATVHIDGKSTIYLEDAGSNRKDMPVCIRYARKPDNPAGCSVVDTVAEAGDTKDARLKKSMEDACHARGGDWIFLNETDHLAPGVHPAIRRIPEPSYQNALRGRMVTGATTIEFDYPRMCGDKLCRTYPGNKMSDIAGAYNTESLAVIAEPDHSHTAYIFTKVHRSLAHILKKQRPDVATCQFDTDGLSDVFRIRNIDSLPSGKVHEAEYVSTIDLSYDAGQNDMDDSSDRVTAANFLRLTGSQGLLLVRTTGHAYKWPVSLAPEKAVNGEQRMVFDVAGALRHIKPLAATVPVTNEQQGVGRRNQEAVAQLDESTIYYMGECKGLPKCSLTMVHDNHPYLAGDVDGNGRIDAADVDTLRHFLAGGIDLYCKAAADANGDNRITQDDVDYLERYVSKKGPPPVTREIPLAGQSALSCGYYARTSRLASLKARTLATRRK